MDVPEEDTAQKSKRASIQEIMKDTTLTPQEKQLKIQAFMASGGKSVASTASVGSTKSAPPSNTAPPADLPPAPTHYPRLLLLISRQTIDRDQKNQGVIETIIKGANLGEPEIVDGADAANMKQRDELFAISGLHAKYPQVFLLESATDKPKFLGDSQGVQDMNEKGEFTKNAILGIKEEKEDKENEVLLDPATPDAPPDNLDAASKASDAAVAPKTKTRALQTENEKDRSIDPPPKSKGLFCCFSSAKNKAPTPATPTPNAPTPTKAAAPAAAPPVAKTKANAPPKAGTVSPSQGASSGPKTPPPPKPTPPQPAEPKTTDSSSPSGNKPLNPTSTPAAAARNAPTATNKNANPFGAKTLKSTPAPAAAPKKTDTAASPFGNVALKPTPAPAPVAPKKSESTTPYNKSLKPTPAATRAPPRTPPTTKTRAQVPRGVSGNNKSQPNKKGTSSSKSRGTTKKPQSKPKLKAEITRVQPSDSHPAGTWYTKTTFQRLFSR